MSRSHRRMWLTNPPHRKVRGEQKPKHALPTPHSLLQHQGSTHTQRHAYPKDTSHHVLCPGTDGELCSLPRELFLWVGRADQRPNPQPPCTLCKHSPASSLPAAALLRSRARLTQGPPEPTATGGLPNKLWSKATPPQ